MTQLDEMYADLQEADALGDVELARVIAAKIKEVESAQAQPAPTPQEEPGLLAKAGDLFTGNLRATEETDTLPDWGGMPEMNEITSKEGWKTAIGTMMTGPAETAQIISANYPGVQVRQDAKGNYIMRSSIDGKEYAIKPGFQLSDIPRAGMALAAFTPAGRATSILGGAAASAGTQAAIEASQAATGGNVDTQDIAMSGVAGGAVPAVIKGVQAGRAAMAPATQQAANVAGDIAEAEARGIPVMTSDVMPPQTFIGQTAQRLGERIPVAGTGPLRASQNEARIEAIRSTFNDFGATDLAAASTEVMEELAKHRSAELTKWAGEKSTVIQSLANAGAVPVPNAIKAVDDEIAKLAGNKSNKVIAGVIDDLEQFKANIQGKGIEAIEIERKALGEKYKAPELAGGRSFAEKATSTIYKKLRDDIYQFVEDKAGKPAQVRFAVANKQLSNLADEGKSVALRSLLKKGTDRPEDIQRLLFSTRPSDVKAVYRALSPEGRAKARQAIISKVAEDASKNADDISPEKFANSVAKLSRNIGVFFSGDELAQIKGLSRAIDLTRRASGAKVQTNSGQETAPYVGALAFGQYFGLLGGVAAAGGSGLAARVYESRPVRDVLIKLANVPPRSPAAVELTKQLQTVIQSQVSAQESKE